MDQLLTILENTLSHRHNIWMFYTIIVTTVFGFAYTEAYRSLGVLPRVVLSVAVGAAVWYNFYAIVTNTQFVHYLVENIREGIQSTDELYSVFHTDLPNRYNPPRVEYVNYIYFFINFALFIAMWWDECVLLSKWVKKKIT